MGVDDVTIDYTRVKMRTGEDLTPPLPIAAETNVTFRAGPYQG
ncbi:hypothetical protein ACWGJ0_20730 [Streptomyces massasporeus]